MNQYTFNQDPIVSEKEIVKEEILNKNPIEEIKTIEPITNNIVQTRVESSKKLQNYRVCSINQLKVYKHPTNESEVIGGLNHDTVVTALDQKSGWLKIKFRQDAGWIAKNRTVEV